MLRIIQGFIIPIDEKRERLDEIETRLLAGKLYNLVGPCFPLEKIAIAHEVLESGKVIGKVVLEIA